jgi:hypothetical protein
MMKKFVLSNKPLDGGDAQKGRAGLHDPLLTTTTAPPP